MSDKMCGTCRWWWKLEDDPSRAKCVMPRATWPDDLAMGCGDHEPYPPPETARYRADSAMLDWIEANCYVAIPGPKEVACDHQGGVEDKPLRPKIIAAMEKGASGDICGL